jgi:hypothetical protein
MGGLKTELVIAPLGRMSFSHNTTLKHMNIRKVWKWLPLSEPDIYPLHYLIVW